MPTSRRAGSASQGAPSGAPHGELVVVSNRGPAQLRRSSDGSVVTGRARGGLASSLAILLHGSGATWVCAAMAGDEREIVAAGDAPVAHDGVRLSMVVPDEDAYTMAYSVVSNSVLWFAYHDLFDKIRRPALDGRFATAWRAYREVNQLFADEVAAQASQGATVLVQDYQLHLVGSFLKKARPDVAIVHFVHTPFCDPSVLGVLPDDVSVELLTAMSAYDACGFHSPRWSSAFLSCCETMGVDPPPTFAAPLAVDEAPLAAVAESAECRSEADRIRRAVGKRRLVVRVDRVEPSKNILRGFLAFDRLLEAHPEWRGNVTFLALAYPSRETLAEYRAYRAEIETVAARVNARWSPESVGTPLIGLDAAAAAPKVWRPIILGVEDYYPRSVAALSLYDVLLVNPVRDGLNLVAKEGPLVNGKDGAVVLSRQAGVWDELHGAAVGVNPFDIAQTAEAISSALALDPARRAEQAAALRDAARRTRPQDWLEAQLAAGRSGRQG